MTGQAAGAGKWGAGAVRSVWVFTGALLAIVLGSVVLVHQLDNHANEHRQAQVVASELEQDAADLRDAVDALMTGEQVEATDDEEISSELAELDGILTELREVGGDAVLSGIETDLRSVDSALRSQLAAFRAGELGAAEEIDEQRTGPAFEAFGARVEAANSHYEIAAGRASRISDIGLWVALLLAGVAISGLSLRHERARRATQLSLQQRLRDRVAEVAAITEQHRQLEALKYSFVSATSHELRTPLTAIHGSLEMLEDGDLGPLPPAAARVVSVAARGTRRLARLVEDILDLERLEGGHIGFHPARHDLHALLLDTVESLTPLTERAGIELVLHEAHADVLCDGDRVLQALVNVVGNAIKFTPPGGSIHLEAVRRGREVEVTVRDEGQGIPAEQLVAVFDRFYQVDTGAAQTQGGAGLGLTITRHILEAQGGRIWVESEVGAGTIFHLTLPLALPQPNDPEHGVQRASPGRPALTDR